MFSNKKCVDSNFSNNIIKELSDFDRRNSGKVINQDTTSSEVAEIISNSLIKKIQEKTISK